MSKTRLLVLLWAAAGVVISGRNGIVTALPSRHLRRLQSCDDATADCTSEWKSVKGGVGCSVCNSYILECTGNNTLTEQAGLCFPCDPQTEDEIISFYEGICGSPLTSTTESYLLNCFHPGGLTPGCPVASNAINAETTGDDFYSHTTDDGYTTTEDDFYYPTTDDDLGSTGDDVYFPTTDNGYTTTDDDFYFSTTGDDFGSTTTEDDVYPPTTDDDLGSTVTDDDFGSTTTDDASTTTEDDSENDPVNTDDDSPERSVEDTVNETNDGVFTARISCRTELVRVGLVLSSAILRKIFV